ncbi:MAG TPA: bifunctional adenosylcobinamide kinase/adenosylcobinamide-phosphate guanylyltransferase [Candidatus Faecalibacterium gallistercoris]|uniref:Bifunctional adenosylcobinamide kinase/adenosylcobinamide-phosphate guanylyltransferase n=1 Tax=Candidatus Faecalibacterium gallistercoris TaxID=2838579 RepID=A0A9D2JL69_9FIRM|nr:bifunctional adenosylcobinamide kinase/adenosylcobinamide-phosphate guanylyltransferase [Candidatus Faecalibacterium gallistercoris]
MTLITGPLWSGKRDAACRLLGCTRAELAAHAVWDVQELAAACQDPAGLEALADRLAEGYEIVILTEEGGGVVPADPAQRAAREKAGRLACLLAARAGCVVRVFCGLPLVLKGECKL